MSEEKTDIGLYCRKEVEKFKGAEIDWEKATEGELFLLLKCMMEQGPY